MGSGSGIQSFIAQESGAKSILAADIDSESIKFLKSKKIKAIKSNLFSNIKGKFELIAFNPPYLPLDSKEDKESKRITTGGKEGDEISLDFLKQAKNHLTNEGIILLLLSSLTPFKRISFMLKKEGFSFKKISEKKIFFENLFVLEIKKSIKSL
jgi:release factor glutamine methyltransferase